MNKETILVVIAALIVGGISGYSMTGMNHTAEKLGNKTESAPKGMHRMPDGSMMGNPDTSKGSMNGMDHMMSMMVESERAFMEGMIPHHQEAVDTAKEVIARGGTTPEIKKLAENIVIAQEKEIAEMKTWYKNWYGVAYTDKGKYMPMMRDLSSLSAKQLDQMFLEDMIMHHMGAIMMANSVQPYIEHQEIETLTKNIVSSQSAEISEMRQMLKTLK